MIQGKKINFLTFSDSRYDSWKLIYKEAVQTGWFDRIVAGDERLFEKWYTEKYKNRFKERGFGYWQWKSYLIRRELDRMDMGDILLYCDAGCKINRGGYSMFCQYIDILSNSDSGVLVFEQGLISGEFTKADVFNYFGVLHNIQYTEGRQIYSGVILLMKCKVSFELINQWYYIMHNEHHLATDELSSINNLSQFVENRHDQSILDILTRLFSCVRLPENEVYRVDEDWQKMIEKPIWITRRHCIHISFIKYLWQRLRIYRLTVKH